MRTLANARVDALTDTHVDALANACSSELARGRARDARLVGPRRRASFSRAGLPPLRANAKAADARWASRASRVVVEARLRGRVVDEARLDGAVRLGLEGSVPRRLPYTGPDGHVAIRGCRSVSAVGL